jgi:hypothetical protein
MTRDGDIVIVALIALMVLLLAAGAEQGMWRRRSRRAMAGAHLPTAGRELVTALIHQARCSPEAGLERSIIKIVAVYHTYPAVVVGETADGALLERSLHELADMPEILPPRLWQELVEQYHVFQSR